MGWATADGDNRGSWWEGYKGTLDFSPSFSININLLSTLKFISLKKKKMGKQHGRREAVVQRSVLILESVPTPRPPAAGL